MGGHGDARGEYPAIRHHLHLTVVFLGAVTADAQSQALGCVDSVARAGFDLSLVQSGTFANARVAWVAPSSLPHPLLGLRVALARSLDGQGLSLDRKPFTPHVTLVRRCERSLASATIEPVAWRVRNLVLYESRSTTEGVRYIECGTWKLGA